MAVAVWLDGHRVQDLPPVVEKIVEELVRHRNEIRDTPRGAVIADFGAGQRHVDVSVQPAKIRLGGGST